MRRIVRSLNWRSRLASAFSDWLPHPPPTTPTPSFVRTVELALKLKNFIYINFDFKIVKKNQTQFNFIFYFIGFLLRQIG